MEKVKISLLDRVVTMKWLLSFLVLLIVQFSLMWHYLITEKWVNIFVSITIPITGVVFSLFVLKKIKFGLLSRKVFVYGFFITSFLLFIGVYFDQSYLNPLNRFVGEIFGPIVGRYMGMVGPLVDSLLYMFMMLMFPLFFPILGGILVMMVYLIVRKVLPKKKNS
ncbi:MAG: hypothetical protein WC269_03520 [Candidatus Gracilibacteria bacterium]|jgi:hypothetical protein